MQGTVDGQPFDDVHGAGWRLVTVDAGAGALEPAARAWSESVGGQVVPLPQPHVTYARWFAEHETARARQRPDFRLYGTATTPGGATTLLRDLRRQLDPDSAVPAGR